MDSDGTLTISGTGSIYLSSSLGHYIDETTSLIINDGITEIYHWVFRDLPNLTTVTIADSVTNMNHGVFIGCTNLKSVKLSAGLTSIGEHMFENCTSLTDITFPNGLYAIGAYAFAGCESLTEVVLPSSVHGIGWNAFSDCTSLSDVTICSTFLDVVGMTDAFSNCEQLTLHGFAGSDVETYASSYDIPFEALDYDPEYMTCSAITPQLTESVMDYLNTVYIEKYPELALDFSFGSDADKQVLETLNTTIITDSMTDAEKAMAISSWVDRNIKYESMPRTHFPIDVFYNRVANCEGYSLLISQLLRLCGIPAVACSGTWGDMDTLTQQTRKKEIGHAWVYAYYDNEWHLFDPLIGNYDVTDMETMARWYFPVQIEGVHPYSEYTDFDSSTMTGIYYSNGRFMYYYSGIIASHLFGSGADFCTTINGIIFYPARTKFEGSYDFGVFDGYDYLYDSMKKTEMALNECYNDGWFSYGSTRFLAKPNGILYANTIQTDGDKTYYLGSVGDAHELSGSSEDYTLTYGYLTIQKGDSFQFPAEDIIAQQQELGRVIVCETSNSSIATVDENGLITGTGSGTVNIHCYSKDSVDSQSYYVHKVLTFYVADTDERTPDYTDRCLHKAYASTNTEPTCTEEGYTTYTCTGCGKSYTDNYVNAYGHSHVNGICIVCDSIDADRILLDESIQLKNSLQAVTGLKRASTYEELEAKFVTNIQLKNHSGDTITSTSDIVKTGDIVQFTHPVTGDAYEFQLIIKGDTNGDGKVSVLDMEMIQKDILHIAELSGVFEQAGLVSDSSSLSVLDMEAIQKDILGIAELE